MYLTVLSEKIEIKDACERLITLLSESIEPSTGLLGHQGVSGWNDEELYYHKEHQFWVAFFPDKKKEKDRPGKIPKYWFGYGLGEPNKNGNNIICEIN